MNGLLSSCLENASNTSSSSPHVEGRSTASQIGPRFNVAARAAVRRSVTSTRFGPCSRGAPCTTFSLSAPSSSVRRLLQHPRLARGRVPPALHDENDAGRPSPRDGDRGGGCLGARVVDAAGGGRRRDKVVQGVPNREEGHVPEFTERSFCGRCSNVETRTDLEA